MKRYFSISLTSFAFSIFNVLMYFLLGLITGNTAFSGIFSIIYPLQFIVSMLLCFFSSASNIRANKEGNKNCIGIGMILGAIVGVVIFTVVAVFIDNYIEFMNMSPNFFKTFTLMAVGQLFCNYICSIVTEKLYFENNDKLGNFCMLGFIFLNLLTVVVTALITSNQTIILLVNFISLIIYVSIWFCFNVAELKFNFNALKNFRFESINILGDFFMLLIYLFGFRRAFGFGIEYYTAISFINLITDPLWDGQSAINQIAKIDISQHTFNYKKAIRRSAVVTMFFISIGTILFFTLFKVYNVILTIGIIYFLIQVTDMLLNIAQANVKTYLQLEYSSLKTTTVHLTMKVIRTGMSILLFTPFNTDIAQISCNALGITILLIIFYKNFKTEKDGSIMRKMKVSKIKEHG